MEALRHIYDPAASVIKENLTKLGSLRYADIHYMQYSSRYDKLKAGIVENAFKKELSNGALMDIGIYCTSLAAYLFGEPEDIKSMSQSLSTGADGEGCAMLSYEDGLLLQMSWSKICDDLSPSRITGEEGTMLIDSIANPNKVETEYRSGERELIYDKARDALPWEQESNGPSISGQFQNNMVYELCYFIKTAEKLKNCSDTEPRPDYEKELEGVSRISMKTADAIRREQDMIFPDDRIDVSAFLA